MPECPSALRACVAGCLKCQSAAVPSKSSSALWVLSGEPSECSKESSQAASTCSKLTIETLEQSAKYVQG